MKKLLKLGQTVSQAALDEDRARAQVLEEEAAAAQAKAKAEAKERWDRIRKEEFEKRIQEKRKK